MKLVFSGPILEKYSVTKEGKNQSEGTKLFHGDGQTHRKTDEQIDMAKLIAIFAILRTRQKTIHYIILTFFRHISRQLIGYKH
jgi:hypothetical protein